MYCVIPFKVLEIPPTTKAVNVQFVPCIAFSILSTTSTGNRIVLFIVGGISGILKVDI